MSGVVIFKKALTGSFQTDRVLMIERDTVTLGWQLTITADASVEWYLEFADHPTAGPWYRETAQEDVGSGEVNVPAVVRTFQDNGGGVLTSAGSPWALDTELVRRRQFVRVQARVASGTVTNLTITAAFGSIALPA